MPSGSGVPSGPPGGTDRTVGGYALLGKLGEGGM
ncbi:MAG: Protein kinase, partial [Nocardioides sp.]|nr:Protein kinase [Nocardioides sp.]